MTVGKTLLCTLFRSLKRQVQLRGYVIIMFYSEDDLKWLFISDTGEDFVHIFIFRCPRRDSSLS